MENIKRKLNQLSADKNITILYACETGSRAWGFPSPDSDYDIRFIYKHDTAWYLSLSKHKDSIEMMDGDLDATGWDLRKSLLLLKRSNAPLIERFQSPVVYMEAPGFANGFRKLIDEYYNPIAIFFHHYSLAQKFWIDISQRQECKLKSLFYLLRSLLSCNWILHDDRVLPMHIEGLMQYSDPEINEKIREMVLLKATKREDYQHLPERSIKDWISATFIKIEAGKSDLKVNNAGMKMINNYFLRAVYENDNHRNS